MELFTKAAAGVLLGAVLALTLSKTNRDLSLLLGLGVCSMVLLTAAGSLRPVAEFMRRLETAGGLDGNTVSLLLKAVGIGLLSRIAGLICTDSGNQAMGKALEYLASAVILCLSLPMLHKLLELMERILGEI